MLSDPLKICLQGPDHSDFTLELQLTKLAYLELPSTLIQSINKQL
jgi:hypothetical protein